MNTSHIETLNASEAAERLVSALGGAVDRWATWLANDRRKGRVHRIPAQPGPGRPRYSPAVVDAFIDQERAKQLAERGPTGRVADVVKALGVGQPGGSPTGRQLDCRVTGQLDEQTGEGFVQFVVASPLLVYRLSPQQARQIAGDLVSEAKDADHLAKIARGHA